MCNLSQGIEEKGIAIGEAGLIVKMYKNGFTAEQIAAATDKDLEAVKKIIADKEPMPAQENVIGNKKPLSVMT